ncbi:MAG: hypothetical protein NTX19_01260 [Gemmatimonadetes bacterium]|nr:hypothetical protein [Gemmatimonadota bacterium]
MYQSHRGSPIKWFIGFVISVHIMAGLWAADRAWKQVRSMSLIAGPDLAAGSRTRIEVVTSGRAAVTVVLTLAQGARTDTIAVQRITAHRDGFWDPRFITRVFSPRLTPTQMAHFKAGAASLRAEARGGPQWLREPPPVICEVAVTILPE